MATDDALDPRLALAERLDAVLYGRRLGLALTAGDMAILRGQGDGDLSEAGVITHLKHSLEYSRDRVLFGAWWVKHQDGLDNPRVAFVQKIETWATRMAEDAATRNQATADTPLDQFSTDDASADPEALKSALTRLERAERTRKLTNKERGEMERLRSAVRSQRDTLKLELAQRGDDLHELRAKHERDKLKLRPSQNAWHHDAAGVEICEESDGEGIADLLGDNF